MAFEHSLLTVSNISKSFGGVKALDDVSFDVKKGQIKSLIGPNGAGKTTLFNIISGTFKPDTGKVIFKSKDLTHLKCHLRAREGIGRTFQIPKVIREMNVLDNTKVGLERRLSAGLWHCMFRSAKARREEKWANEEALRCLQMVGLEAAAQNPVHVLTGGQLKLMQVARALASNPELILLDEPSSGLNDIEIAEFIHVIHSLKESGCTALLVEHNFDLVSEISDEIVVLNLGSKIAEGVPDEIQRSPQVKESYLGME